MTRICTLVDRFPPLVGGAEIQAKQLSLELARRGISVIVLTRRVSADLPHKEIVDGLQIYRVPPNGIRGHVQNILSVFTFTYALLRYRREYDLIHVHDMFSLFLAAILIRILIHKPLVVKVPTHGNVMRRPSKTTRVSLYSRVLHNVILPRKLWLWLLNRADAFIAISDEIAAELATAGLKAKTMRVTNAVDISRFCPSNESEKRLLREKLSLPQSATIIVSHGRIVERKRIDLLLKAMAQICEFNSNIYLVLPGPFFPDGTPLEHHLREMVKSLNLLNVVEFSGPTTKPEDYLRAADIFMLTSELEGMPNAVIEAMACGLPCVASEIGGVTDLIEDGKNGYLFTVGDSVMLVQKQRNLLDRPEQAAILGNRALTKIRAEYTWDVIIPQYMELYRRLLNYKSNS